MTVICPRCRQRVELSNASPGRQLVCPACGQGFTAAAASVRLKRRGGGKIVLGLLAAVVVFGYVMLRFGDSPGRAWNRMVAFVEAYRYPAPPPASAPTPEPAVVSQITPAPADPPSTTPILPRIDPLVWLAAHRERWPKEIVLKTKVAFPIVYDGRAAGVGEAPSGTAVQLVGIDAAADRLTVAYLRYGPTTQTVPSDATDLREWARGAMAKAEAEATATPRPAVASTNIPPGAGSDAPALSASPPRPAKAATREEVDASLATVYTSAATNFRLYAPAAKTVGVVLYDEATGNKGRTERALRRGLDEAWELRVPGDLRGKFYTFALTGVAGSAPPREILDPSAMNAVASSRRARLGPLPAASLRFTPAVSAPTDMVIYEMHVRDFSVSPSSGVDEGRRGKYLGFAQGGTHLPGDPAVRTALDHLVELGVTHVELMPVQDYQNDEAVSPPSYNWGYIPAAYFSPEGAYASEVDDDSRVREFKTLVDALHARGLGVIMDVVYNHTAPDASLAAAAPGDYYRHLSNGALANGSACGNEVRTESPAARKLILDSLRYWTREYGIDGYRFDLMALLDQETMRQAERTLHAINPDLVLFGEPWTAATSPLADKSDKAAMRCLPVGAFNDDFRNALKGSPDGSDPGFIQDGSNREALQQALLINDWLASPNQSVNYLTCHDNLVLWDKLRSSMPNADDARLVETMKLGYLALFTAQGVPFLHGGEEFARTKGGNNNSFDAPDAVNALDWSLKKAHRDLYEYTRAAIALRKAHPVFRLRSRQQVESRLSFKDTLNEKTLLYTLNGAGLPGETWPLACVVLNADDRAAAVSLPAGRWAVGFDAAGAAPGGTVSGKMNVPAKSGLVLYQR